MDVRTQDAIQRLKRDSDFLRYVDYISGRRQEYFESLANYSPDDVVSMARTQGYIHALAEVLRIPEDALQAKNERTTS